jgi:hypothetical protein
MNKLNFGTFSFKKIIENNILYADKTEYIYNLIKANNFCLLTRPRRFGKTLLLSTIEELFKGNKELFKGLWIYSSDYDFMPRQVITFSMNNFIIKDNYLEEFLIKYISEIAEDNMIKIDNGDLSFALRTLIKGLKKKYNQAVVVLIDEYDSPITKYIHYDDSINLKLAKKNAKILHDFYTCLKNSYDNLDFVLTTGVTRFSMAAFDSGANNFFDISLNPRFNGICGFTIDEFDSLFSDYLIKTLQFKYNNEFIYSDKDANSLRDQILDNYDGYTWGGDTKILNPFSILNFFNVPLFASYWPNTGQLKHFKSIIQKQLPEYLYPELKEYSTAQLTKLELESYNTVPILFYSGYLTINSIIAKAIEKQLSNQKSIITNEIYYTFKIPNSEVEAAYNKEIYNMFFDENKINFDKIKYNLQESLLSKSIDNIQYIFNTVFSSITYLQQILNEKFFHAATYLFLYGAGIDFLTEQLSSIGRSDLVIIINKIYIIVEFKYIPKDDKHTEELKKQLINNKCLEALNQIENKGYDKPYQLKAKEVINMAMIIYGHGEVTVKFA